MTRPHPATARPPIWVVSLARATDRRRSIIEGFAGLGAPFELVDAVDGSSLSPAEQVLYSKRHALFEIGRELSRGDFGCSLSHLRLYERMVANEVPVAVIVEDDVVPNADLVEVIAHLDVLPPGWDVVTFHSLFESAGPTPIDDRVIAGRYRVCRFQRTPFGTQCYAISLAGAQRALRVGFPVCMPPDELLFRRRPAGLDVYGLMPNVVHEGDFGSELHARPETVADSARVGFTDRLVVLAGRAWRRIRR